MNILKLFRRLAPPSVFDVFFAKNGFSFDFGIAVEGQCIEDFGGDIFTVSGGKVDSLRDIEGVFAHNKTIREAIDRKLSLPIAMENEYSLSIHVVKIKNMENLSMILDGLIKYRAFCQDIGRPEGDPRLPTDCRMVWS